MNMLVKIASILFLCAIGVCSECRGRDDARESDDVWLLVWQYPQYPIPGVDLEPPSGLIAAVRTSGVYYRALSDKEIGSKFVTGKISPNKLREMKSLFDKRWFRSLSEKCRYVVLHVPTVRLEMGFRKNRKEFAECNAMDNARLGKMLDYLWALPVDDSTFVDLKSQKLPTPSFDLDSSPQR